MCVGGGGRLQGACPWYTFAHDNSKNSNNSNNGNTRRTHSTKPSTQDSEQQRAAAIDRTCPQIRLCARKVPFATLTMLLYT